MAADIGFLELLQQTRVLPGFIYYSAMIIACKKGQRWHQALGGGTGTAGCHSAKC